MAGLGLNRCGALRVEQTRRLSAVASYTLLARSNFDVIVSVVPARDLPRVYGRGRAGNSVCTV